MERELINAYDHMTMPDDCARRIESRLQAEMQSRKPGRYTKTVSPFSPRRSGRAAAAACLMLVLVVGGAALKLWMTADVVDIPVEHMADYSVATDIPADVIEAFASEIRKNLLEEDWETFSRKVQYPISILVQGLGDDTAVRERYITGDGGGMVGLFLRNTVNPSFLEEIRKEKCTDLFCNWQGICMADGRIWINEIDGQLKITAINGLFADTPDPQNFVLKLLPDGYVVTEYAGQEAEIVIPAGNDQNRVKEIGTGEPVIRHGDKVKTIQIPETVRAVRSNAFANCSALEAVYFEGDAPAEAEGVFEGSENVTVYYRKNTRGWGDTWCGRKTMEYDGGYISLGTVTVQDRIPAALYDSKGEMAIREYCSALWGENVQAKAFTVVDMDRDGVCELVLKPQDADGITRSYLVLRDDGTGICGYTLRGRDLRKDGTFYSYTAKENARLRFRDALAYTVESVDFSQQDKPLVQWHVYPCQMPDLVLESYRYASETGTSTHPGNPYAYFELLSYGEMGNDWNLIQQWLSREGICIEDKDMFYAFDPDAPGCVFYGTLTGEGDQRKLSSIGYYVCDENGEKRAEVWDLDQPKPVYTVKVSPDDRSREVDSPEEMLDYMDLTPYYGDIPRDAQKIAELLDGFVYRYSAHDMEGMQEYMAADVGNVSSYPFDGDVYILTYGILPDTAVNTGESWHTTLELLESGEPNAYYHLSVVLAKQSDGWKIQSYGLEKQ